MSYADRPWVKHYDAGVPASLEPFPNKTVHALLEDVAAKFPNNPVSVMSARLPVVGRQAAAMTYGQLNGLSDCLAAALADKGVRKGDRVAINSPNCTQFLIAFFGILKAGGIVVALNPTYPPAKQAEVLNDSGVETVITMSSFYKALDSVRKETPVRHIIVFNIKEYLPPLARTLFTLAREKKDGHYIETLSPGDEWLQALLARYTPAQRPAIDFDPAMDIALFQYTGGTTGLPKAAKATHRGLVINSRQIGAFFTLDVAKTFLAAAPFFHVYGLVAVLILAVDNAGPMYMVMNPRDTLDVIEQAHHFRPTVYMGVPALYNAINMNKDVQAGKYNLSSIKACISGSAPLPPDTKRRFEDPRKASV